MRPSASPAQPLDARRRHGHEYTTPCRHLPPDQRGDQPGHHRPGRPRDGRSRPARWPARDGRTEGELLMVRHVVGIDLGTTNSVVASVDDSGSPVVLPNASGREITPSVVYFEPDGSVVVGEDAVQATAVDPDNGVQLIKRAMGTEFPLRVRGQQHTPESISALILRQLVSAAVGGGVGHGAGGGPGTAAAVGEKVSAVITVPAYFGLAEREA